MAEFDFTTFPDKFPAAELIAELRKSEPALADAIEREVPPAEPIGRFISASLAEMLLPWTREEAFANQRRGYLRPSDVAGVERVASLNKAELDALDEALQIAFDRVFDDLEEGLDALEAGDKALASSRIHDAMKQRGALYVALLKLRLVYEAPHASAAADGVDSYARKHDVRAHADPKAAKADVLLQRLIGPRGSWWLL